MSANKSFLARKFELGTGGGGARTFFFYLGLLLLSYAFIHTLVIVIVSFLEFYAIFLVLGLIAALPCLFLTTMEPRETEDEGEETQESEGASEGGPPAT